MMRRPRRAHLLFIVAAILQTFASSENKSLGALFLPRDVAYDNSARKALQKIRRNTLDQEELLSTSGNRNQATMTMVGYKGGRIQDQVNQDRAFCFSTFSTKKNVKYESQLMGVFDGHGNRGEEVAEYALHQLPNRLVAKLEAVFAKDHDTPEAVKRALIDTFVEIDESVPTHGQGGCTASVVLQLGNRLYIANAGDSISLVVIHNTATNTTRVVYTSREDKPDLPEERARVERMGGTVHIPKDPREDSPRVMYTDPETGYQMGLAMSRSIGDWDMVGVIANPIVDVLDLRELIARETANDNEETCAAADETCTATSDKTKDVHVFAISATDGMMDYVSPRQLADTFASAFYQNGGPHPLIAAEDLILTAAKGWNVDMNGEYRDDIAIVASKIEFQ